MRRLDRDGRGGGSAVYRFEVKVALPGVAWRVIREGLL
jgi:hypothetical protein